MLKVYYCSSCDNVTYLQYDKDTLCKRCNSDMDKIDIAFTEFTNMNITARAKFIKRYFH